jgi:hypothetical protein
VEVTNPIPLELHVTRATFSLSIIIPTEISSYLTNIEIPVCNV